MKRKSARLELEKAFKEFTNLSFPPSAKNEELQDAHGTLILYDADVAAAISRILATPMPSPDLSELSGLREDRVLENMVKNLVQKYPNTDQIGRVAREYANYYKMIKKVLHAAHSYLDSLSSNHT